ncbi:MAG TPA: hypothetical protein VH281_02275 [Gaiellaceae bacterium]
MRENKTSAQIRVRLLAALLALAAGIAAWIVVILLAQDVLD